MVVEHLVDVGRRNAAERMAHFLLELGARLSLVGLGSRVGYAVLVLIFSMLVVGAGDLQDSGAIALIVGAVAPLLADMPPIVALAAVYLPASTLTETVHQQCGRGRCDPSGDRNGGPDRG